MAKFLKTRSKYLTNTSIKLAITALLIPVIGMIIGQLLPTINAAIKGNTNAQLIFLGITIPTFLAIIILAKYFEKQSDNYFTGDDGELEIEKILKQLPDEYIIIPDIKKTKGGNIDFVVVGPTGIFALEVKNPSHATAIGFNGTALTFNGKPCKKDPLKQALRSATGLGKDLQKELNDPHIFVNAVVVFANHGFLHFGLKKVYKNARIIGKEFLIELLTLQQGSTFSPEKTEKIITTLSKLYNFPLPPAPAR